MHKHLTWTDRLKIEKGLKEGLNPCKIADLLTRPQHNDIQGVEARHLCAFEF